MAEDYCTVAEVKAALGITDADEDALLGFAATSASRQIDGWCGRSFWQDNTVTTREVYATSPTCVDLLDQDGIAREISTTTGLIVKIDETGTGTFGTTLTITTDFLLLPRNATADGRGYSELLLAANYSFPRASNGRAGVQITAQFGWPSVPTEVKGAAILLAKDIWKNKDMTGGALSFGDGAAIHAGRNWIVREMLAQHQVVPVG